MARKMRAERLLSAAEKQLAALQAVKAPNEQQKKQAATLKQTVKSEKFSRLAKKRVGKALTAVKLIGNLSGSGYAYTPEQVTKINTLLNDAVKSVVSRFAPGQKMQQTEIEI